MSDAWPTRPPEHPPALDGSGWSAPGTGAAPPPPPAPSGEGPTPTSGGGSGSGAMLWTGVVVAVVVAVVGAAALVFLLGDDDGDDDAAPAVLDRDDDADEPEPEPDAGEDEEEEEDAGEDPEPVDLPPVSSNLDDEDFDRTIAELARYVEEVRGLEFLEPVVVEVIEDEAFVDRLLEDFEEDAEDLALTDDLYTALDLIDDDVDLADSFRDLLGVGVLGFYDPETGELVVRGDSLSLYTQETIVHELVHALDDQHFDLDREELEDVDDERGYAFSALVEGNARRLDRGWRAELSSRERSELEDEELAFALEADIDPFSFPLILIDVISSPYEDGSDFLDHLIDEEGPGIVDELFETPPETSEQILHPDAFLDGAERIDVAPPPADGEIVDEGAIGELFLDLLLDSELAGPTAREAAVGWGGDWYVAWRDGDETCVRADIATDSDDDFDELLDAVEEWADEKDDAEVETLRSGGSDLVRFTICN